MKLKSKHILCAVGVVVAGLVAADLVHGTMGERPATKQDWLAQIPADVRHPELAAVRLTGADLAAFKKREPLRVGRPGPRIETPDYRRREQIHIPAAGGAPTVCVVSCGCRLCAGAFADMLNLRREPGAHFQLVGVIANRSREAWGHYASGFLLQPVKLSHDTEGKLMRLMRPPGQNPTVLPLVWVSDGGGIVRYVGQPRPGTPWKEDVRRVLKRTAHN